MDSTREPRQRPAVDTSAPSAMSSTPRREREMKSPLDIKPSTPSLRRMSLSHTSQARVGVALPQSAWTYLQQAGVAAGLAGVVCVATALSLLLDTAVDTSLHPYEGGIAPAALPRPYFARKANLINVWCVKYAWAWTTAAYALLALASLPLSRRNPTSTIRSSGSALLLRLAVPWAIATGIWAGFTTWFFGHGLFDRLLVLTGAECALPLDAAQLSPAALASLAALGATTGTGSASGPAYLPLPPALCASRTPLNALSAPEIFGLMGHTDGSALPLRARWRRGHDISGHTFLLVLAVMLLARQLGPAWSTRLARGAQRSSSLLHTVSAGLGTALVALWVWMLLMTGLYFHNPQEKLSGLLCGLLAAGAVEVLSPSPAPAPGPRPWAGPPVENENRARRGSVVDDGKVLEPPFGDGDDDNDDDESGDAGSGKMKQS